MKKIKIAYQGIKGAYSEQAILEISKKLNVNFQQIERLNFNHLFEYINDNGLGVVPIENSNAGTVTFCVDLLREYDNFEIIGEYFLKVDHFLLSNYKTKFSDIKKIYSHPQALAQCSSFLNKNKIEAVPFGDTAGSAKYVKENNLKDVAVIGSELLSNIYNLQILKKKFQNNQNNVTRFLLVKNKKLKYNFEKKILKGCGCFKTTIIFETKNIPGALYKCLGGFVSNGINLTKIESRPSSKKNFDYFFFLEFEGNLLDKNVKQALEELKFFSKNLKIYSSYKIIK